MRVKLWAVLFVVELCIASLGCVRAGERSDAARPLSDAERMPSAPHYRPPVPNAPKVRVDGRARGVDDTLLTLTVLAPEHVGLTTKEQPCLYWYQSKAAKTRFELTISIPKSIEPLLEVKLEPNRADGIQRVCLADYKISLKTNIEYRWSVAMIVDPDNRSKDILASGMIKRVAPPATLLTRLSKVATAEFAYVFADEGFWYDSLDALSALIDDKPGDKRLREIRSVYFMQAGLPEAARFEMRAAGTTVTGKSEPHK